MNGAAGDCSLLLAAAVCEPERAGRAWAQWRAATSLAEAPAEATRVMSVVAARLDLDTVRDDDLGRLVGQRRYVWAQQVMRAGRSAEVAGSLAEPGIDGVFFKGLALLGCYERPGMRTMGDSDLLVPWAQRHAAIDALASLGFQPVHGESVASVHAVTGFLPGYGFRRADGLELDLHWRPLHDLTAAPDVDAVLFARARSVDVGGVAFRAVAHDHHAVLVAAHALRRGSGAELIGVVDLCQLLVQDGFDPEQAAALAVAYSRVSALAELAATARRVVGDAPHPQLAVLPERLDALRAALPRPTLADRRAGRAARSGRPVRRLPSPSWSAGLSPPVVAVGERLAVADFDRFAGLLRDGWWPPEAAWAWSVGDRASLALRIAGDRACTLTLHLSAYLGPGHDRLRVDLRAGRRRVTRMFRSGAADGAIAVELDGAGVHRVTLRLRRPRSPMECGAGDDRRRLGVALHAVEVSP